LRAEMKMMLIASGHSFGNSLEDAGYLLAAAKKVGICPVEADFARKSSPVNGD
ncbi:hypothetical protein SK128_012004, partial [Halocaridina rubra]